MILRRDPICVRCNEQLSTTADHVVPLKRGGDYSLGNGQGLCTSCHSIKTREENRATP